jgi:hypothetical protein
MVNHYKHNVDITREPFLCSDCEVYLADDGTELDADTLEQDWTNTPATA